MDSLRSKFTIGAVQYCMNDGDFPDCVIAEDCNCRQSRSRREEVALSLFRMLHKINYKIVHHWSPKIGNTT